MQITSIHWGGAISGAISGGGGGYKRMYFFCCLHGDGLIIGEGVGVVIGGPGNL